MKRQQKENFSIERNADTNDYQNYFAEWWFASNLMDSSRDKDFGNTRNHSTNKSTGNSKATNMKVVNDFCLQTAKEERENYLFGYEIEKETNNMQRPVTQSKAAA